MSNRGSDRERSRSRDARPATGEAGTNAMTTRSTLPRDRDRRNVFSEEIRCRDSDCNSDTFRVYVDDPNRPQNAELECVRCGTMTAIDPARRLLYHVIP